MCTKNWTGKIQNEIKIRKYDERDIPNHYQAVHDSLQSLQPWFSFAKLDYSQADSENFIKRRIPNDENKQKQYHFAIVNLSGEFLGSCSLKIYPHDKKVAVMTYWVKYSARGKGVGKTAAKLLKEIGCSELGVREIHLDIADCNVRSIRVVVDIGAAEDKRTKKIKRYDGKPPAAGKEYVIEC